MNTNKNLVGRDRPKEDLNPNSISSQPSQLGESSTVDAKNEFSTIQPDHSGWPLGTSQQPNIK
jgi:hypothetical protein